MDTGITSMNQVIWSLVLGEMVIGLAQMVPGPMKQRHRGKQMVMAGGSKIPLAGIHGASGRR